MKKTAEEQGRVARCPTTGKKKSTHAQAKKEAKFLKYHKKYANTVPQAYFHKPCGWWHVGNSK
jgi:hypothetical protein